jgi:nitroimidazol reductase NimA-like FMN-containing flavoprotein (pyridoxamine 5'-phosphate oxidase superfamily)
MDHASLEPLSREDCMDLLRSHHVGRVAVVVHGFPVVLPVNYRVAEHSGGTWVALRTRPGGVIDRAPQPVALEIDGVDEVSEQGWSVLVRGSLLHVDSTAAEFSARFDPEPWLTEDRTAWLVIEPFDVTGRRLLRGDVEWPFSPDAYV